MKRFNIIIGTMFMIISASSYAAKIVECQDSSGNTSYQQSCPPGMIMVKKRDIRVKQNTDEGSLTNISAVLYTIPDCVTCDQVKEFLTVRNIPIEEKDVKDDVELQKELSNLAGSLEVPVTKIGDHIISGFTYVRLKSVLEELGYKEKE